MSIQFQTWGVTVPLTNCSSVSHSVVTATRFTVGAQYFLLNVLEYIKKYEANHSLKMFPDSRKSFTGLKVKVTAVASLTRVRVVVDHTMLTPPHNKVKDLALIFWSVSLPHQGFIFCQKYLEQAFFDVIFHSHPFNEMFIVSGKFHAVTTLLQSSGLHPC